MATPTVHAVSTATADSGTGPSIVIPDAGAGAAAGDLALLVVAVNTGTVTSDMAAAGWTAGPTTSASPTASGGRLYTWTRTLASGDLGSTVTLTLSGSSRTAMVCLVTSPASVDASAADPTNSNGTAVTTPSVTATVADGLLVTIHGTVINAQSVSATWTADAATTEQSDVSSGSVSAGIRNSSFCLATQALTASGATGTRTATSTQTMQRQGISLVLAGSGSQTGAATLTAASGLTAAAVVVQPAAATMSAASALAAAGTATLNTAAPFDVGSSLTATATVTTYAAATLTAASGLIAAGSLTAVGAANLSATSGLSAATAGAAEGAATLAAASGLSAEAVVLPMYQPGVLAAGSSRPTLTATTERG